MALIQQHHPFDPDRLPAPVLGIAAELAEHDSGCIGISARSCCMRRRGA